MANSRQVLLAVLVTMGIAVGILYGGGSGGEANLPPTIERPGLGPIDGAPHGNAGLVPSNPTANKNDKASLLARLKGSGVPNDKWLGAPPQAGVVDPNDPDCWVIDPSLFPEQKPENNNRCAPYWFVVGCLKTGTTSLYSYLSQHPKVKTLVASTHKMHSTVRIKEPSFFNARGKTNINEYYSYLPVLRPGDRLVTGEASPGYIFWHDTPDRLLTAIPHAHVVVLFRNPVQRAFSRVNHILSMSLGSRINTFPVSAVFDHIVADQIDYVKACLETSYPTDIASYAQFVQCSSAGAATTRRAYRNPGLWPESFDGVVTQCYSVRFIEHSLYWPQLMNWQLNLEKHGRPATDLLVVKSEDFYGDTANVMNQITAHLKLSPIDWKEITSHKYNVGAVGNDERSKPAFEGRAGGFVAQAPTETKHEVSAKTLALLEEFYAPHNEILYKMLGKKLW